MPLRKPTRKKYPNAPKANASADAWIAYRDKVGKIQSEYAKALADYNRDVKAREKAKEDVKKLKSKK
jgi:hypothetical protein